MNEHANQNSATPIEELPDRMAHRRKIADRLARYTPEYAADDPSRSAAPPTAGTGYSIRPRSLRREF
jgi:hypothetical protein